MSARSNIGRALQVGKELTQGVAVPANKLLQSLNILLDFAANIKTQRAQGFKFDTTSSIQRPLQRGTYDGQFSYNEAIYPFCSLFGTPTTVTTPTGGTLARNWAWLPRAQGQDTIQTFTIEEGDASGAERSSNMAFTSVSLGFGEEVTIKGNVLARASEPTTLTANPTGLKQVIASADEIDVYMTETYTNDAAFFADANKITDAYTETFDISEKLDPRFVHNTLYKSFKDLVEKPPTLSFGFFTEHNLQSQTLYAAAVKNAFRYVGIRLKGPVIEGSINYGMNLIIATNVVPDKRDLAGQVWGFGYKAAPIYDPVLGSAFKLDITNIVTSL